MIVCALTACILFHPVHAQTAAPAPPHGSSQSPAAGVLFYGASKDPKIGPMAWLISIDKAHQTGRMFFPPRMLALSKVEFKGDGSLTFRSTEFFDQAYRFNGTLKTDALSGTMLLIDAKSAKVTDKWDLAAVPLLSDDQRRNAQPPALNTRYSNVAFSSEGGDQTGVDILFFPTTAGQAGIIVFYESYWSEPTSTSLPISQIETDKAGIHFAVQLPDGLAHYHLLQTPTGGLFNRDDGRHAKGGKDIPLKKRTLPF